MRIESVDFFYLSMPEVHDIADGSQDACLVRVRAGDEFGWGECEAAPLPSITAFVCPMSHSACKPVQASVLGQPIDDVTDIQRIGDLVREQSLDLLQADHSLSGIDMALWDLLGKRLSEPAYRLLGYKASYPKLPYSSMLFGDTPSQTYEKAYRARTNGFRAAKFGWGPIGSGTVEADVAQFRAAREGLGEDGTLLVDVGTVWREDVAAASKRVKALRDVRATWLEEPFVCGALEAYKQLSLRTDPVKLAGGEGCHNFHMARQLIDFAGIGYVQIDAGRIGGISVAKRVADYACARGVTYVNHSFTSHLQLSASLQPFVGLENDVIAEYPVESSCLATDLTTNHIERDKDGFIHVPDAPGLGMAVNVARLQNYLVDVEIRVGEKVIYRTPHFD
jgi:L-alanine-DL-glutamate epimerase-like enolase superfamily enzyme